MRDARESVIVALDTDAHEALRLARLLSGHARYVKIGMTLFYAEGPGIVARLKEMGFEVFLDLKLHDIPHQVEGAARSIARLGVSMLTVHASGGVVMMEAAVRGACEGSAECGLDTPAVLAVTVLTSFDADALGKVLPGAAVAEHVSRLASLAREAGAQGAVCSPLEAAAVRDRLGPELLVVTPGVRPKGAEADDQARVATFAAALASGASHVVVGRPIVRSDAPLQAFEALVAEGDADGGDD